MPGGRLIPFARLGVGVAHIVTTRGVVPARGMRVKAPAARAPASAPAIPLAQPQQLVVEPAMSPRQDDGPECMDVIIKAPVRAQGIPMSHPVHGRDVPVAPHRYPPRAVAEVPIVMIGVVVPARAMQVKVHADATPASAPAIPPGQPQQLVVEPAVSPRQDDGPECMDVIIKAPVRAQGIPMSHLVHGPDVRVGCLPRIPTRPATIRPRRRHRPRRLATIRLHR